MKPKIIAVCGGSGSGKTTIVEMLCKRCGYEAGVLVMQLDHYYLDLSHLSQQERDKRNFDRPDAFDLKLLSQHLQDLANGKAIQRPTYDFATHTRLGTTVLVQPQRAILVDGFLALGDPSLKELYDLSVYVDVSDDVRFIRRLRRDVAQRGRTVDGVITQYLSTVKPMHDQFVAPQKYIADLIVSWEDYNYRAIDMLAGMLTNLLAGPSENNPAARE